jgi:hypothetical protein
MATRKSVTTTPEIIEALRPFVRALARAAAAEEYAKEIARAGACRHEGKANGN